MCCLGARTFFATANRTSQRETQRVAKDTTSGSRRRHGHSSTSSSWVSRAAQPLETRDGGRERR